MQKQSTKEVSDLKYKFWFMQVFHLYYVIILIQSFNKYLNTYSMLSKVLSIGDTAPNRSSPSHHKAYIQVDERDKKYINT